MSTRGHLSIHCPLLSPTSLQNVLVCPRSELFCCFSGLSRWTKHTENVIPMHFVFCRKPEQSCSYISKHFISQCSQVYTLQRLMVFDDKIGIHMDVFRVPSCCSCHVKGYAVKFPDIKDANTAGSEIVQSSVSFDQSSFPDNDAINGGVFSGGQFQNIQIQQPRPVKDYLPNLQRPAAGVENNRDVTKIKDDEGKYSQPDGYQVYSPTDEANRGKNKRKQKQPVNAIMKPNNRPQQLNKQPGNYVLMFRNTRRPQRFRKGRRPVRGYKKRPRRQRVRRPNSLKRRPVLRGPTRHRVRRPLRSRFKKQGNRITLRSRFQNRASSALSSVPDASQESTHGDLQTASRHIRFSPSYAQDHKPDYVSTGASDGVSDEEQMVEEQVVDSQKMTTEKPMEGQEINDEFMPMTMPTTIEPLHAVPYSSHPGDSIRYNPMKRPAVPIPFITPKENPAHPGYYNYDYHPIIDYMLNNKSS